MAIIWGEGWSVGVPHVDAQHRELIDRVNQLVAAFGSEELIREVPKLLRFLDEYVVTHFQEEERLLRETGYPLLLQHKRTHDRFIADLRRLQASASTKHPQVLALEVNRHVCDWLQTHILQVDKQWSEHVLANLGSPAEADATRVAPREVSRSA